MYSYVGDNPTSRNDPSGEDYKVCVSGDNSNTQKCTQIQNEAAFQSALANPGTGITVKGNNDSGTIYGTNASGQKVQVGTYEEVAGPGSEGGGLQNAIGADMFIGSAFGAGVNAISQVGEAAVNAVGRMLGLGAEETTPVVTTQIGGTATVDAVVARASSAVGNQSVQVASEDVARQAADQFLGPGKVPITERSTGGFAGWKSADGTRVVLEPHFDPQGAHMNLINKLTGSNLHVRW